MQNTIEVEIKSVYGLEKIYPVCHKARMFAEIAGTNTLTNHAISRIKQLGYKIEVVPVKTKAGQLCSA